MRGNTTLSYCVTACPQEQGNKHSTCITVTCSVSCQHLSIFCMSCPRMQSCGLCHAVYCSVVTISHARALTNCCASLTRSACLLPCQSVECLTPQCCLTTMQPGCNFCAMQGLSVSTRRAMWPAPLTAASEPLLCSLQHTTAPTTWGTACHQTPVAVLGVSLYTTVNKPSGQ